MDVEGSYTYYTRLVMIIIFCVEFILFISFAVWIHDAKDIVDNIYNNSQKDYYYDENKNLVKNRSYYVYDDYNGEYIYQYNYVSKYSLYDFTSIFIEQKKGMDTCLAFFIIFFIIFLAEFIVHFACKSTSCDNSFFRCFFKDGNHGFTFLSFILAQFIYFIACLLIPIYLDRVRTFKDFYDANLNVKAPDEMTKKDEIDLIQSIVIVYAKLLAAAFTFLFIFIFLYFVILNLYKGLCCDMREICEITNNCVISFFRCFYDNIYYAFNCEMRNKELNTLVKGKETKIVEIGEKNCKIKNLMKENIELRVKNIEYL